MERWSPCWPWGRRRNTARLARLLSCAILVSACSDARVENATDVGERGDRGDRAADIPGDSGATSLARAAGGPEGHDYTVRESENPGVLMGTIGGGSPRDTSIAPTHDLSVCRPFTESIVPSRDGGVGNAVVWLVGVAAGPRDDSARRVRLSLDGCRLEPHIQRVAVGATLLISGRDAMMSRLQFTAIGETDPRATVTLSDAGQLVPTATTASAPGLVEIRDDLHPWVRGWLVVAPHPFVAVTTADGAFRFDGVPPGRYRLVVWHEALGITRTSIRIDGGILTKVELAY